MEGSQRSNWAPIASPLSGADRGLQFMPELDDEALVAFDRGDFDHPYVVGFLWNGVDRPPESDPKNRVIMTPGQHTIRLEDGNPKKVIIRSSSGHEIVLDDTTGVGKISIKTNGGQSLMMTDAPPAIELQGGGRILALKAGQVQIS
jgi:uncharacterized protein involved in type VI secretion and phage assembly